jgi:hypothetical protein
MRVCGVDCSWRGAKCREKIKYQMTGNPKLTGFPDKTRVLAVTRDSLQNGCELWHPVLMFAPSRLCLKPE